MDAPAALVWTDSDAPALCLVALGLDRYLPKAGTSEDEDSPINWSPETWKQEIEDDCGIGAHPANLHKLAAGLSLLHTPDEFYRTAPGFHTLAEALGSMLFDQSTTHPLSGAEVTWAIIQAHLIAPPGEQKFDPVVSSLINRICKEDGYATLPKVLPTLGVLKDPSVWTDVDYSTDPETGEVVAQSQAELNDDLDNWLKDRLLDLAERIARLPLRRTDPAPVATELRQLAGA